MVAADTIAIVQVLTAVGALFVAGWSFLTSRNMAQIQREHNYRSFQPIAYLRLGNFKSGFSIELSNEGVGPLIIEKVVVRCPAKDCSAADFVALLEPEKVPIFWDKYAQRLKGRTISPHKSITLLSLFDEKRDQDPAYDAAFAAFRASSQSAIAGMFFSLDYKDIYGRKFSLKQDLSWLDPKNAGIPERGMLEHSRDELGSDVQAQPAATPNPRSGQKSKKTHDI